MRCDHHAQIESRVRLYLSAGEDNYIEFASQDIARVEQVPDPPAPLGLPQTSTKASKSSEPEAKLSQADLGEMLARAGKEHNLDVDLLASVVKAESGGNARAVSRAGARGLMQLMPGTAAGLGVEDSFKPDQNVRGGSAYLDALLTRYDDNLAMALAAYNAGPAAVDKYPRHSTLSRDPSLCGARDPRVQSPCAGARGAGTPCGRIHHPMMQRIPADVFLPVRAECMK